MRDTQSRHELPRVADGWTFVYLEHCTVHRDRNAVVVEYADNEVALPSAPLLILLLGPGTTLTHAAMCLLGETGCSVVWCGENGVRCYASGANADRRARNIEHQARQWADPQARMEVVCRMYRQRFREVLPESWTIEQIRGREGVRVREAYALAADTFGVVWHGRNYDRSSWDAADPVNKALSVANSCLYGLCHGVIAATGFSPALGFIHSGYDLSFVHDVADLYKVDVAVPIAFEHAHQGGGGLETRVRKACRRRFFENRILERIFPDIQRALGLKPENVEQHSLDDFSTGGLWDGGPDRVPLGTNWGGES
jgi:CRISPR-associated protein Cas1